MFMKNNLIYWQYKIAEYVTLRLKVGEALFLFLYYKSFAKKGKESKRNQKTDFWRNF